jgi:hypothetical protein
MISVRSSLTAGGGPYGIEAGSYGAFGLRRFNPGAAAISVRDLIGYGLTGVWSGDDGGFYYVRQEGQRIWWGGFSGELGLQVGLAFCNVFQGSITGNVVEGSWVGVPRGKTQGSGDLRLTIQFTDSSIPFILNKTTDPGGFSASTWTFNRWYFGAYVSTFTDLFKAITKNTWHDLHLETLADRLQPLKEQTVVVFGALGASDNDPATAFDNSFPLYWQRSFYDFITMNNPLGFDNEDADMTTYIYAITSEFTPDFFTGVSATNFGILSSLIFEAVVPPILTEPPPTSNTILADLIKIHPECIMFGSTYGPPPVPLLPGWGGMQQANETSVLINGRPINADVDININGGVNSIGGIAIFIGDSVRISGVFTNDVGHDGGIQTGDLTDHFPEIHPVFTIDVINTTGPADLSGTWGISDGGTCYIRQIGNAIWFLWLRPLFDVTLATTFAGTLAGNVISGKWADIPFGDRRWSGDFTLTVSADNIRLFPQAGPFASLLWRKLYDLNTQQ